MAAADQDPATVSSPVPRRRRSAEERLRAAEEKRRAIQARIDRLRQEVDGQRRRTRNRGLILLGVIVESCIQRGIFPADMGADWWMARADLLTERDREAYRSFLRGIGARDAD